MANAAWLGLPGFTSPVFSANALLLIAPVAIILVAENLGHIKAVTAMTGGAYLAQALHAALLQVAPRADASFEAGDFTESLRVLAALKEPVDAFFDAVMVNAEDPALRRNRLALLAHLHVSMNRVADLSRLATA